MTLLDRLRRGLGATRSLLAERMGSAQWQVSSEALAEVLLAADVGVEAAEELSDEFERARRRGEVASGHELDFLRGVVRTQLEARNRPVTRGNPHVTLVVGVNGTGKTTTAAKMAAAIQASGGVPLLVAADTFRAAAVEQLQAWGARLGVPVVAQRPGADPGAVVFDALQAASSRGATDVLVDTAGRLHTKHNLMAELDKVRRVCAKALPGSPHEVLLVMDASTGINGLAQAREFRVHGGVTGVVLTKLDGTAKGGVVLAVARELELPVRWIGVGEAADDLLPFDADAFTTALLEGLA
ncbi:MAG TPA: signal recognition particle-docking protein FtsY [Thermoanaerobaculaceae bacterium]|nr:signal recognition particle-docking protein FtsY [Thermoanaerobaculaceae bacterium]